MFSTKSILVPVDFSDFSENALQSACDLCKILDADLHLIHVLEDHPPSLSEVAMTYAMYQDYIDAQHAKYDKLLQELPTVISMPAGHNVIRKVCLGVADKEIVKYADENNIGLIVMSTHGRTGISHVLLGSVAEHVIRRAHCPVMVVRQRPA